MQSVALRRKVCSGLCHSGHPATFFGPQQSLYDGGFTQLLLQRRLFRCDAQGSFKFGQRHYLHTRDPSGDVCEDAANDRPSIEPHRTHYTSDGRVYGFEYVNGHPNNARKGCQAVTAFGVLSDLGNGYPMILPEMTITALRAAAMSAVAAKHLAHPLSKTMAIIGNGAQSDLQALAFKAILGITDLRLYDIDPSASERCKRNLSKGGFTILSCGSSQYATILPDNMVGPGVHINAVGGNCPGKTELHRDILLRSEIFVEYPLQTWIEGDIQQRDAAH